MPERTSRMWSFLKRQSPVAARPVAASQARIDRLTYAIGDIHGCDDLLDGLLETIRTDAEAFDETPRLVLLGDYVDRGPNSRAVLNKIVELKSERWCECVTLLGNHEEMLKRFMLESEYGPSWTNFGGSATLASYGVQPPAPKADAAVWQEARRMFVKAFPSQHRALLYEAATSFQAGDYFFVHGGVKPGISIEEQDATTFLWIRDEFLKADKSCDYVVVHGHSAQEEVANHNWRIGVDTGAFATGVLTAVRLCDAEREFIRQSRNDAVRQTG